jgi:hypothetical protein
MMTSSIPFHHAFIFRIFWVAKNSQQLSISIPPPYILWWGFPLPVQTHWMILIVVINNFMETDMGYPKIPKVIVVDNFPVLGEYFMEEYQAVILCSLPFLFKLPWETGQCIFQSSIGMSLYPEIMQVVIPPAKQCLQYIVELSECTIEGHDYTTTTGTVQLQIYVKDSSLASKERLPIFPLNITGEFFGNINIVASVYGLYSKIVHIEMSDHLLLQ